MTSATPEASSRSTPKEGAHSLNPEAQTWQQKEMMQGDGAQPQPGSSSGRQSARTPRQPSRQEQRQQRPRSNSSAPAMHTSNDSRSQGSSHANAPAADRSSGNPAGASASAHPSQEPSQEQAAERAPSSRRRRPPLPAVADAMRDLHVTRRPVRAPQARPGYTIENMTLQFGLPPLGASGNWQQTTLTPIEGLRTPVTLPNGHVLTEPVQVWARYDDDSAPNGASASAGSFGHGQADQSGGNGRRQGQPTPQMPASNQRRNGRPQSRAHADLPQQLQGPQRPQQIAQQPRTGAGPALYRFRPREQQSPSFQPLTGSMEDILESSRQRAQGQPNHAGRQRPPPVENRRSRGARPGLRPQNGHAKNSAMGATTGAGLNQEEDVPPCVICTGPLSIVAVGSCNHKEICARCSLLMRLNYDDTTCPLCKAELSQVILTRWKSEGVPDYSELKSCSRAMWRKPAWARGVLVDDQSSLGGPQLSSIVQGITAVACSVCDEAGMRPFRSAKLLQAHVKVEHGRALCDVCLSAKRRFPLELEAYDKEELAAHMQQHPRCEFCDLHMYSGDELYEHMREHHFTCDICQRAGVFMHFTSADELIGHLRNDHHLCEEAECVGCLIAFASAEELAQHRRERHSRAMPRFNRARARVLPLGLDAFPSRTLPTSPDRDRAQEAAGSRGQRPRSGGRAPTGGWRGREHSQTRPSEQPSGMVMIDDDLGMSGDAFPAMGPPAGGSRSGSEARRRPQEEQQHSEEFPSLQAAAQATAEPGGAATSAPAHTRAPALPPLIKVTVKCPCGRRVSHTALPQGTAPKPIRCDAECERVKRSSRLADAFGIDDPGHHIPWVDRQRDAHYSPELLLYAWHNRAAVEDLERQLADFVADSAKKRASLAPAPKQARHIAHLLAEQYGLATQSFGAEPNRHLQLFKASHVAVPRQPLSRAAAAMPLEDLERAVRAERGFPVHFTDVAPSADLHRILERWEGHFVLSGPHADGSAVARFSRPEAAKEVLDALGGGVRGQYRINRAASSAGAGAAVPPAHAGSCAAAAPRQAVSHQGIHPGSSSSTAVAGSGGGLRPQQPRPTGSSAVRAKIDPSAIRASDMAFEEATVTAKPHAKRPTVALQPSPEQAAPKQGLSQDAPNGVASGGQKEDGRDDQVAENWEDAADGGE